MTDPDDTRQFKLAVAALVAGAVGIGFAPIFVRVSEIGPSATAFWRMALALPLLMLWMRLEPGGKARYRPARSLRDHGALALGGLFFAGDLAAWHWSIKLTTIANATLFVNMAPVIVAAASFVLFGERFRSLFLIGLGLAITGAVMLMGRNLGEGGGRLTGDALSLLAAVFYAGYIISIGRLRASFSTATVMGWTAFWTAAALLPIAWVSGETLLPASGHGWGILIGLALISHVVGQSLIAYGLAHLPAAFGAVSLLVQPVVAGVLAWVLFAEVLGPLELAGAALILAGITLARRGVRGKSPNIKGPSIKRPL